MKQIYGSSNSGNLDEALMGVQSPKLILLLSNPDHFEQHVARLQEKFPDVPSIGVIDMCCYGKKVTEKGVGIVAYTEGVEAVTEVLENASVMPAKHIARMEQAIRKLGPGNDDTVCIDFCTGNDACVLTTLHSLLSRNRICLMGGTGDAGKVSRNGVVYNDACAFAIIKNLGGKVKVYKENIYQPMAGIRLIASDTDRAKYYIGKLNGRSAKQVYMDVLNIPERDIVSQTFKNPFGKLSGKDIAIVSIKEVSGGGLSCYRQVNESDVLTILELKEYQEIAKDTIAAIRSDFPKVSAVFAVNCLFRYLLFTQNHCMDDYLDTMGTLPNYCGFVGYGEHYNGQFVNQSMTCVVFG